ncbi:MAG: hypothetical protein ACOYXA_14355 [Bacteroidota bacterium]
MKNSEMDFEEINQHILNADIAKFQPGGELHFNAASLANPGQVLQKVCGIYKVIRPILVVISNFPLIPGTWKAAIKTFISLMDTLCP